MGLTQLRRAETEPVREEVSLNSTCQPITFRRRENAGHEFHGAWVQVQARERGQVGLPPAPQNEPLRSGH